jgi:hypothetical protein
MGSAVLSVFVSFFDCPVDLTLVADRVDVVAFTLEIWLFVFFFCFEQYMRTARHKKDTK